MIALLLSCILLVTLMPATALADDWNLVLSTDPKESNFIPLGEEKPGALKLNGYPYDPEITANNHLRVLGGDLLVAFLLDSDGAFLEDFGVTKDEITITGGKVKLVRDLGEKGKEFITLTPQDLMKRLNAQQVNVDEKIKQNLLSLNEATLQLKNQDFSLTASGAEVATLTPTVVWQAPLPDPEYDPLSQYVPPENPPDAGPQPQPQPNPQPDPQPDPQPQP